MIRSIGENLLTTTYFRIVRVDDARIAPIYNKPVKLVAHTANCRAVSQHHVLHTAITTNKSVLSNYQKHGNGFQCGNISGE